MHSEVSVVLDSLTRGDALAAHRLLPLVYDELRSLAAAHLARERRDHTLQPTALAHEAYLKLADQSRVSWQGRAHFMAVAAESIRRILVDHARAKQALKRGGGADRVALSELQAATPSLNVDLLDLEDAIQALGLLNPRQAKIVELKYFTGMENREVAEALGFSETLIKNEWRFARAWLARRLGAPCES